MVDEPQLTRRLRTSAAALAVAAGALVAAPAGAAAPAYNLDGNWSVTLTDVACQGGAPQGPYPMQVSGFNTSTGAFTWSFHGGASVGSGVESGDQVTFVNFGGPVSPSLYATVSQTDTGLAMVSVVGVCPNGTGTNEWLFTLGGDLVVNSTKNGVDDAQAMDDVCNITPSQKTPTCTLEQALLISKDRGGATIKFNIPRAGNTFDGTIPQIRAADHSSYVVDAPTTIDGASQPAGGRVEISGSAGQPYHGPYTSGLDVTASAAGSTITGLTINGFSNQITLAGGDTTVQGDDLGTNAHGDKLDWNPLKENAAFFELAQIGVDIESTGNTIGGTAEGQGNVIGVTWFKGSGHNDETREAAGIYEGGTGGGNFVEGNSVGVYPGSTDMMVTAVPPGLSDVSQVEPGLWLDGADYVGSPTDAGGNEVVEARIMGASSLQGNTFYGEVQVTGAAAVGGPTAVPGSSPGNVFKPTTDGGDHYPPAAELELANGAASVQGNLFSDPHDVAIESGVFVSAPHATVGGPVADDGNRFTDIAETPLQPRGALYLVDASGVSVEHNAFVGNADAAVMVLASDGDTITQNTMTGNDAGIALGDGYVANGVTPSGTPVPNGDQQYPVVWSTASGASGVTVTGKMDQVGVFTLDVYSEAACPFHPGASQGETYLGSAIVTSALGNQSFSIDVPAATAGQDGITLTATSAGGDTSEFSPCLALNAKAPGLAAAGVAPASGTVPIGPGGRASASLRLAPRLSSALATKGGRGSLDLLCPALAVTTCTGTMTLRAPTLSRSALATGHFTMAAGDGSAQSFFVSPTLLAAMKKHRRVRASLTTVASDAGGGHSTTTTTVTLVYTASA